MSQWGDVLPERSALMQSHKNISITLPPKSALSQGCQTSGQLGGNTQHWPQWGSPWGATRCRPQYWRISSVAQATPHPLPLSDVRNPTPFSPPGCTGILASPSPPSLLYVPWEQPSSPLPSQLYVPCGQSTLAVTTLPLPQLCTTACLCSTQLCPGPRPHFCCTLPLLEAGEGYGCQERLGKHEEPGSNWQKQQWEEGGIDGQGGTHGLHGNSSGTAYGPQTRCWTALVYLAQYPVSNRCFRGRVDK